MSFFAPITMPGPKAEEIFAQQAEAAKPRPWVMERISQGKEAMAAYKEAAGSSVKRGDFICRNCRNAEIEVKCKTKYSSRDSGNFLLGTTDYKKGKLYDERTKCVRIPFLYTREKFEVLDILNRKRKR